MFHRWSSCQAPTYQSSCSDTGSSSDFSDEEEEEAEETVIKDDATKRYSKKEILLKLKENDGNIDRTVTEVLKEMTHDSLGHLNSQDEAEVIRKKEKMRKKILKIKVAFKKFNKKRFEEEGAQLFIAESQDSFVQEFKKVESDEEEEEEVMEEKVYRKALNKLKDKDTMKRRTDAILTAVREEATKQGVTTTELLAYLLYRESYNEDRKLAEAMLRRFRGGELKENKVSDMKTLAMVRRPGRHAAASPRGRNRVSASPAAPKVITSATTARWTGWWRGPSGFWRYCIVVT
jgi:hypothetical protein